MNIKLRRNDVEGACQPLCQLLQTLVRDCVRDSGVSIENIATVEMSGGEKCTPYVVLDTPFNILIFLDFSLFSVFSVLSVLSPGGARIPCFREAVAAVVGGASKLTTTLSPEAVAQGAATK